MTFASVAAWFSNLPITTVPVLVVVDVVAAVLAVGMLWPMRLKWSGVWLAGAAVIGAFAGAVTIWYVGDIQNTFGVAPTTVDRLWTAGVFAGILVAGVNLLHGRILRKAIAVVAMVSFVVAGGLAVNNDIGQYLTPGQLLGTNGVRQLALHHGLGFGTGTPAARRRSIFNPSLYKFWRAPGTMPTVGMVGQVRIPATLSHFTARDALVYLPPAALVANAPALPVVILMSGQPGSPSMVMDAGHVTDTMNALAQENHGLAPIVVVPDQLGPSESNPMCVDGPLGNSATYILRDVPNWVRSHLRVETGRSGWVIGGFSQGGTCALQFAAAHPDVFGSFIDVSGEAYPTLSSDALAIQQGFAGNVQKYNAAKPAVIMSTYHRYSNLTGFFAVGQFDRRYGPVMTTMSSLALQRGMSIIRYISPGSAHDWTTATNGFARGLEAFFPRLGLSQAPSHDES